MGWCRSNCTETCPQRNARHWWEQVWGVCVWCRGNAGASLLSGGISHPVEYLGTSTGGSQLFLHYFLALLLSFPAWHTLFVSVLPCSCTAVFQIRSCRSAKLFSLFYTVCGSFPCPSCLPGVQQQVPPAAALGEGFAVLVMKYKKGISLIIEISGAQKVGVLINAVGCLTSHILCGWRG